MNRRMFIQKGLAAGAAAVGSGIILQSCSRNPRQMTMGSDDSTPVKGLNHEGRQILYYASLAPSGHNSQPWGVRLESEAQWVIESDSDRWLPVVDPDNREVLLSLGAFLENLVTAAEVYGYRAHVSVIARTRFDRDVVRVCLESMGTGRQTFTQRRDLRQKKVRMGMRRTVKSHLLSRELKSPDLVCFEKQAGSLYYFPRSSPHTRIFQEQAVENFRIQSENDRAQEEMSLWLRLRESAIEKYRDGLTVAGMEISGLSGWYVKHVMSPMDAKGETFRQKGIEKTAAQAKEGGGWLVITSEGESAADLIEAGRRFQRVALVARELGIGIHPMTQTLEEMNGREKVRKHHHAGMNPQFMLRLGYVQDYPDPVTPRRPVGWFVRSS